LQKIEWIDDWPRLADGGNEPSLEVAVTAEDGVTQNTDHSKRTDFDGAALPDWFQTLRGPLGGAMSLAERPGWLRLYGRESPASLHKQALIAARWQSFRFRAETVMDFASASFQQMAGLICIYNTENWMYACVSGGEAGPVLNVLVCDNKRLVFAAEGVALPRKTPLGLAVEVDRETLRFFYALDGTSRWEWQSLGDVLPAGHLSDDYIEKNGLVFTGSFVGVCCQDLNDRTAFADFDSFAYIEK
jgi:xylan 1,4-beta-xylosidase